jgi:hypothetical protein
MILGRPALAGSVCDRAPSFVQITVNAPLAVRVSKKAVDELAFATDEQCWKASADLFPYLQSTEDFYEGLLDKG